MWRSVYDYIVCVYILLYLRWQVSDSERDVVLWTESVGENVAVLVDHTQRTVLILPLLVPLTPGVMV